MLLNLAPAEENQDEFVLVQCRDAMQCGGQCIIWTCNAIYSQISVSTVQLEYKLHCNCNVMSNVCNVHCEMDMQCNLLSVPRVSTTIAVQLWLLGIQVKLCNVTQLRADIASA